MKKLLVLRHAKSRWDEAGVSDFERDLNDRGLKAAPFMGKLIRDKDLVPKLVVSSPAKRAAETTRLAAEGGKFECDVRFDRRIYAAGAEDLLQVLREIPAEINSAMLVGHNPGMEDIVELLTSDDVRMPTAALAVIEMDITDWSMASKDSGSLASLYRAKEEMKNAGK